MTEQPNADSVREKWLKSDRRDRAAERWLMERHSPEWYIGDATAAEWDAAYTAVDAAQIDGSGATS